MSRNSQIKYRESHPTVTMTCKSKQQYENIVEQAKQLNLSISDYLKKVINSDINSFDEGKRMGSKECDGEWQATIETDFMSKEEYQTAVDKVKEDATEERDKQWRRYIKEKYEEKEVVTFLRRSIRRREAAIEGLTKSIEEGDEFTASLRDRNIDLNNDNTALRKKIADLNDHIENFLDDAGRREKNVCVRKQNKLERKEYDFDQHVSKQKKNLNTWRLELVQLQSELAQQKKDQNKRNEEQDERDEKQAKRDKERSEGQKVLDGQAVKQQKKDTELKQKEYELEQKRDATATVKKDLMDFAEEIGHELLELGRVEQKIERNKHFLFLTGEREKVLGRIPLS